MRYRSRGIASVHKPLRPKSLEPFYGLHRSGGLELAGLAALAGSAGTADRLVELVDYLHCSGLLPRLDARDGFLADVCELGEPLLGQAGGATVEDETPGDGGAGEIDRIAGTVGINRREWGKFASVQPLVLLDRDQDELPALAGDSVESHWAPSIFVHVSAVGDSEDRDALELRIDGKQDAPISRSNAVRAFEPSTQRLGAAHIGPAYEPREYVLHPDLHRQGKGLEFRPRFLGDAQIVHPSDYVIKCHRVNRGAQPKSMHLKPIRSTAAQHAASIRV
jgi:hypothetical protein